MGQKGKDGIKKPKKGDKQKFIPTPKTIELDYRERAIKFSFEEFDTVPSISVGEWHKLNHCIPMVERFLHYGKNTKYKNMFDKNFKSYGAFPLKSKFHHPEHVTKDANWASMRLGNLSRVIGHLIRNTLYIIFFDPNHEFSPSDKD